VRQVDRLPEVSISYLYIGLVIFGTHISFVKTLPCRRPQKVTAKCS